LHQHCANRPVSRARFELERKWEKLRKRPDIDIAYFKASEGKIGRGEFEKFVAVPGSPSPEEHQKRDSISREFLSLIPKEEHIIVHRDFTMSFRTRTLAPFWAMRRVPHPRHWHVLANLAGVSAKQ